MRRVEEDLKELAKLFSDLDNMVSEQDPMVEQTDQMQEDAKHHVAEANLELDGAIERARSARRKRWWCGLLTGTASLHDDAQRMTY